MYSLINIALKQALGLHKKWKTDMYNFFHSFSYAKKD